MRYLIAATLIATASAAHAAPTSQPVDPDIAKAVSQVSAARMKANDEHLVAFGTRSTFSEGLGDKRGVFAAREWIAGQFREIAKSSGGPKERGRLPAAGTSVVE